MERLPEAHSRRSVPSAGPASPVAAHPGPEAAQLTDAGDRLTTDQPPAVAGPGHTEPLGVPPQRAMVEVQLDRCHPRGPARGRKFADEYPRIQGDGFDLKFPGLKLADRRAPSRASNPSADRTTVRLHSKGEPKTEQGDRDCSCSSGYALPRWNSLLFLACPNLERPQAEKKRVRG